MPGHEVVTGFFRRLFGRRPNTPAEAWLARRAGAPPEEVIRQHFAAIEAHDLDWILATLAPERARLYADTKTLDKRRQTVLKATVLAIEPTDEPVPLSAFAERYAMRQVYRVEFDLSLVEPEKRRDPTLQEGKQWAYFLLVSEGKGRPWLIADWGR
jgi:uncharacterized protein YchJ